MIFVIPYQSCATTVKKDFSTTFKFFHSLLIVQRSKFRTMIRTPYEHVVNQSTVFTSAFLIMMKHFGKLQFLFKICFVPLILQTFSERRGTQQFQVQRSNLNRESKIPHLMTLKITSFRKKNLSTYYFSSTKSQKLKKKKSCEYIEQKK